MSSRYYNDHHYDSYPRSANGSSSSRRRTYDYVKINPLLKKAKAKAPAPVKVTGYSTALGRKKPKGEWRAKQKEEEDDEREKDIQALKNRKDAFEADAIEAELSTFKKGTFVFDAKAEAPKKKESRKSAAYPKLNGDSKHSKFHLKRTSKKHPPPISDLADYYHPYPNGRAPRAVGARNGGRRSRDDDSKESSPSKSEDMPQRSARKKSSRSRKSGKKSVQTIVTVSPSRVSNYGGYARPVIPDYFYGPGHQAPHYGYSQGSYYGYSQRSKPLPVGAAAPGYGSYPDAAATAMEYYYGGTMEDGAWYPYQDPKARDSYSSPTTSKRDKRSGKVDLTTGGTKIANGDTPMSPGRRVNKIQKQLEYYFSAENMKEDNFLQDVMDESGWVLIETILEFKRMKILGATKELVTEAAFHSTAIEIDAKKMEKIRADKLWKQYAGKRKKSPKKKRADSKAREKERQRQLELDNAELNDETIEAIVAAIEAKQERRERRRREREIAKEKAKIEAKKRENEHDGTEDDSGSGKQDESKLPDEAIKKLIEKDQQQGDDEVGDPDGNDMVNID